MTAKKKSRKLRAFVRGMARTLDLGAALNKPVHVKRVELSDDAKRLRTDMLKVGRDFRIAADLHARG